MMNLPLILSLSCLILCVFSFIYCRSYLKRRTSPERLLAEFREEVNGLLAEIDEKTDRDALLVEERIKRLRAILEDADKRIAVYVRELDRRGAQERAYAELGKNRLRVLSPAPASPPPEAAPPPAEEPGPGPRFTQAPRAVPPRPAGEEVAELARAGFSPRMIASRLGLSQGEVEMAIDLAKQKGSP
jgi:DNA-binding NarL/FixJ family response regulator